MLPWTSTISHGRNTCPRLASESSSIRSTSSFCCYRNLTVKSGPMPRPQSSFSPSTPRPTQRTGLTETNSSSTLQPAHCRNTASLISTARLIRRRIRKTSLTGMPSWLLWSRPSGILLSGTRLYSLSTSKSVAYLVDNCSN